MDMSDMKNIVVLKNLPSNLIDEAIIVLKENKKVHKYLIANNKEKQENENNEMKNDNAYIVREAEMIIKSYMEKLEQKSPKWKNNIKKLEKRYENSIKLNFLLLFTTLLGVIFTLI